MRANERSERPSGPFKTRSSLTRNAPKVLWILRMDGPTDRPSEGPCFCFVLGSLMHEVNSSLMSPVVGEWIGKKNHVGIDK